MLHQRIKFKELLTDCETIDYSDVVMRVSIIERYKELNQSISGIAILNSWFVPSNDEFAKVKEVAIRCAMCQLHDLEQERRESFELWGSNNLCPE